jgi:hypothetical protein
MTFEPGDIAACYSPDWIGRAISLGTVSPLAPRGLRWGPSHVAMLCEYHGERLWVESTALCATPCLIRRQRVRGAQAHRPQRRIDEYLRAGGRIEIYRLTPLNRFTPDESRLLTTILLEYFVRPGLSYDFPGAILSGTRVLQLSRLFPGANLEQLFCSELIAAVMMRLHRMNHANPTRYNPARLLRQLVRTGKYRRVRILRSSPTSPGSPDNTLETVLPPLPDDSPRRDGEAEKTTEFRWARS